MSALKSAAVEKIVTIACSNTVKAMELKKSMERNPIRPLTLRFPRNTRICSANVAAYPGIAISRYSEMICNNCFCSSKCEKQYENER